MNKSFKRIMASLLAVLLMLSLFPGAAFAYTEPIDVEADVPEASALEIDALATTVLIEDELIRVTVDEHTSLNVYRRDGNVWTPMNSVIEPLGPAGATAEHLVGKGPGNGPLWAGELPWSSPTGEVNNQGTRNFHPDSPRLHSPRSAYVTVLSDTAPPITRLGQGHGVYGMTCIELQPGVELHDRIMLGHSRYEELLADDFELVSHTFEENVATHFGTGNRLTVLGVSPSIELERRIVLETGDWPGAVAVSTFYRYVGPEPSLNVFKFVEHNFKIEDYQPARYTRFNIDGVEDTKRHAGLWSFQGTPMQWGNDVILPIWDNMGTGAVVPFNELMLGPNGTNQNNATWNSPMKGNNFAATSQNNWFTGEDSGIPYNFFWGENVGIGIGSFMPHHVYGMELPVRGSAIAGNHSTAYTWLGWNGTVLERGEEERVGISMLTVAHGDQYMGARVFARAMDRLDIRPFIREGAFIPREGGRDVSLGGNDYMGVPLDLLVLPTGEELPSWAFEPLWETWGYNTTMDPGNMMDLMPLFREKNIRSITYDDGWYWRMSNYGEGTYLPEPAKWAPVAPKLQDFFAEFPHPRSPQFAELPEDDIRRTQFRDSEGNWLYYPPQVFLPPGEDPCPVWDFRFLPTASPLETVRVVRAMNEFIHINDMYVTAWAMQVVAVIGPNPAGPVPSLDPEILNQQNQGGIWATNPDWIARKANGWLATEENARNARMCTGNPEVINEFVSYLSHLVFGTGMFEYHFDGFKGDSFYGMGPCFGMDGKGNGHGHDGDIWAARRNYGTFFKYIFDYANYLRGATEFLGGPIVDVERVAVHKNCMCGGPGDYFIFSGINRPVWGDHDGTRTNRAHTLIYRGLYSGGEVDVPVDGDHHDLDMRWVNAGDNAIISAFGTGHILASKVTSDQYNDPTGSGQRLLMPHHPNYARMPIASTDPGAPTPTTNVKQATYGSFAKFYGLSADLRLTETQMIGGLYTYGVDYPEGIVLENSVPGPNASGVGDRFYSFFATTFAIDPDDPQGRAARPGTPPQYQSFKQVRTRGSGAGNGSVQDPWNDNRWMPDNTLDGPLEIRGLAPNTSHAITNIETGTRVIRTSDANGNIVVTTTEVTTEAKPLTNPRHIPGRDYAFVRKGLTLHVSTDTQRYGSVTGIVCLGDAYNLLPPAPFGEYLLTEAFLGSDGARALPYEEIRHLAHGAKVTIFNEDGEQILSTTTTNIPESFYAFPLVPAGLYTLEITHPFAAPVTTAPFAVVAGQETVVDVAMDGDDRHTITGTVTTTTGAQWIGSVRVINELGVSVAQTWVRANDDGQFTLPDVPVGTYTLRFNTLRLTAIGAVPTDLAGNGLVGGADDPRIGALAGAIPHQEGAQFTLDGDRVHDFVVQMGVPITGAIYLEDTGARATFNYTTRAQIFTLAASVIAVDEEGRTINHGRLDFHHTEPLVPVPPALTQVGVPQIHRVPGTFTVYVPPNAGNVRILVAGYTAADRTYGLGESALLNVGTTTVDTGQLWLPRTFTVNGQVFGRNTNEPVHANVRAVDPATGETRSSLAALRDGDGNRLPLRDIAAYSAPATGNVVLAGVPMGRHDIAITARGFVPAQFTNAPDLISQGALAVRTRNLRELTDQLNSEVRDYLWLLDPATPGVLSVEIGPRELTSVDRASRTMLFANVDATWGADDSVVWALTGNTSEQTRLELDEINGVSVAWLVLGPFEEASELTVTATSVFNPAATDSKVIAVGEQDELVDMEVHITPYSLVQLDVGESLEFGAIVLGTPNQAVTWTVTGSISASGRTTINANGVLSIAPDEQAIELQVFATSVADANVVSSPTTVSVVAAPQPVFTLQLPLRTDVDEGGRATLRVAVAPIPGRGTIEYVWFRNGVPIAGASGPELVITSASAADTGIYHVVAQLVIDGVVASSATSTSGMVLVALDIIAPPGTERGGLREALADATERNEDDYSATSWAAFVAARDAAQAVFDNPASTQAEIDAAEEALRTAIAGLGKFHPAYMFGSPAGEFQPRANITRAQVAAILARTMIDDFEPETLPGDMTGFTAFSDVNPSNWFFHYVAWAYDAGLIAGDGRGRFLPNDLITRQELAAMLARTIEYAATAGRMPFTDVGDISGWADNYVYTAFREGWMVGDTQNRFRPRANITRAEVATAVNRILGRIDSRDALAGLRTAGTIENEGSGRPFPDVAGTAWYFASVLGAANDHYATRGEAGDVTWMYIRIQP